MGLEDRLKVKGFLFHHVRTEIYGDTEILNLNKKTLVQSKLYIYPTLLLIGAVSMGDDDDHFKIFPTIFLLIYSQISIIEGWEKKWYIFVLSALVLR